MANRTGYLLSDLDEICPENADFAEVRTARPTPIVIYSQQSPRRKIGAVRKRLLDSIVTYVYRRGQHARTAEERDAFSLALALLGAVRRLEPRPFEAACYQVFGSSLEKYRQRRAEQQWRQHQELMACLTEVAHAPVVTATEVRRPETGTGNLYAMPPATRSLQQKPLRAVPKKAKKAVEVG